MKELTIKEKAKAYDEALERARIWQNNLYDTNDKDYADELNYIFPELKRDEDEEIRKVLINMFKGYDIQRVGDFTDKEIIAWLEKQAKQANFLSKIQAGDIFTRNEGGELVKISQLNMVAKKRKNQGEQNLNVGISSQLDDQMSANNNESKFNIGDEIKTTNEEPLTITKIDDKGYWSGDLFVCSFEDSTKWELVGKFKPKFLNGQWIVWQGKCYNVYDNSCGYELLDKDGFITSLEYGTVEVNAHLWTIADAKDGDVLADNVGVILFKSIRDNNVINYYAYLSGLFAVQKGEEYWGYAVNCKLFPATKEQRERFFAAMHDAGYEWDAEKKELKKIDQNPEDKVVPKFKVKDWVVTSYGKVNQVVSVDKDGAGYTLDDGVYFSGSWCDMYHLWTIQDAKDGDVLFQDLMGGKTFIYNGINPDMAILYSFIISNDGEDVLPYHIGEPNTGIGNIEENKNIIHPATKEQRDALIKAMANAGYIFDFEKKELKKIENEIEIPFGAKDSELQEATYFIPKGFHAEIDDDKVVIKKGEKPTAWSENDEYVIERLFCLLNNEQENYPQLSCDFQEIQEFKDWITSLKNRITWKPSEEQIDAFEHFVRSIGESDYGFYYDNNTKLIYYLLEQLKQL